MSAVDLLRELKTRGVHLVAVGDRLRFAPKDAVSGELVEKLRTHKPELIALLAKPASPGGVALGIVSKPVDSSPSPVVRTGWSESDLIDWFYANYRLIPRRPFWIYPCAKVRDVERFLQSLREDIAKGPNGPRWRNGVLRGDLMRLRELFG